MNVYLMSLIDRKIEDSMSRFSRLPGIRAAFYYGQNRELEILTKKLADFYIRFFRQIGFLPGEIDYYKRKVVAEVDIEKLHETAPDPLCRRLVQLAKSKTMHNHEVEEDVFPVHLHYTFNSDILLVTGVGLAEGSGSVVSFFLHELGIPRKLLEQSTSGKEYLQKALAAYVPDEYVSIRALATDFRKNYNQFQNDCKEYFGDTFYHFYTKMKMLDVVADILYDDLSLKEIAYKNDFSDYNALYKVFNRFGITMTEIPRLYLAI